MTAKQTFSMLIFVAGLTLTGLAAINFAWRNPAILGPLALPIGMTPLFLLFQFSIPIPGRDFFIGLAIAVATWMMLRSTSLPSWVRRSLLLIGFAMVGMSALVFMVASAYYDVGMAGPPAPSGWNEWVDPGTKVGEVGLVLLVVAAIMKLAFRELRTP